MSDGFRLKNKLKTKIKIRPISNRLQRFELCIIKEGDMEMVMEELTQFPRTPKIPIHVILNNRTISGFASDNYDAILWSFELAKMRPMENFKEDPDLCFILSDGTAGRHAIVCPMPTTKKGSKELKVEWINDIMTFKNDCTDKFYQEPEEPPELKNRKSDADQDFLQKKAQFLNSAADLAATKTTDKGVDKVSGMALQAVQKELMFEDMQEREELIKEKDEYRDLMGQYNDELLKEKCMERSITARKNDSAGEKHKQETAKEIDRIKDKAKNQVLEARTTQRKRMEALKRAAERRKQDLKNKISGMRNKMANKVQQVEKVGNPAQCMPNPTEAHTTEFCNTYFATDPVQHKECKDPKQFCFVCCETEFGDVHQDMRDNCYDKCQIDDSNDKNTKDGRWVYVSDENVAKKS